MEAGLERKRAAPVLAKDGEAGEGQRIKRAPCSPSLASRVVVGSPGSPKPRYTVESFPVPVLRPRQATTALPRTGLATE